ncbi:PREDICTED: transcriptional protein SWT1-like [Nicrophorus vespilloides]|uniref:Transcriptional protein SWT1-like n=1 Tax=Nicrophorus vespilloides TaxID=110193 RepID=A0ABM1NJQ9_NICVS|nr:PREDICTED: transcriptional protein SWT1-like [Nicrophorus vespilloides]
MDLEHYPKKNNRKRKRKRKNKNNRERIKEEPLNYSSNDEAFFENNRSKIMKLSLVNYESPSYKKQMGNYNINTQCKTNPKTGNSTNFNFSTYNKNNNNPFDFNMVTSTENKKTVNIPETILISSFDESLHQLDLSNASLICNANSDQDFDDDELMMEMELNYTYIPEQYLLEYIHSMSQTMTTECSPNKKKTTYFSLNYEPVQKTNSIYIVIDTNMFIDKLETISNILQILFCDGTSPVIYVPWIVVQELDNIKDGYNLSRPLTHHLRKQCRKAIQFINDCLVAKKGNFIGESIMESATTTNIDLSSDDSILKTCLRMAQQKITIMLTSNLDLRNKCNGKNIYSCCPNTVVNFLHGYNKKTCQMNAVHQISKRLSLLLSLMFNIQGKEVDKRIIHGSYDFKMCITYMKNFKDVIFKSELCRKVVDDLHDILCRNKFNEKGLIESSLSLLTYLKSDADKKYGSIIDRCIEEVTELKKKH